jgi:hypothetical protein
MRLPVAMTSLLVATSLLAIPATAAPLGAALSKDRAIQTQSADQPSVIQIQHRRGGHRGGGGGDGGAVAAGVLGGLLLGAVIANEAQRSNSVDYCMRRFRSYDPQSGTYLGRDGYRHSCP